MVKAGGLQSGDPMNIIFERYDAFILSLADVCDDGG